MTISFINSFIKQLYKNVEITRGCEGCCHVSKKGFKWQTHSPLTHIVQFTTAQQQKPNAHCTRPAFRY